ncbi:hypothetical protein Elgi_65650 [Paenibacillus elgii]|nr:hypothetical protein Elgi_65650 [Paenibacillus elgii]
MANGGVGSRSRRSDLGSIPFAVDDGVRCGWRSYPQLRRAIVAQGALFAGFSAFWSTLSLLPVKIPQNLIKFTGR